MWDNRSCFACGARLAIRRRFVITAIVVAHVIGFGVAWVVGHRGDALRALAFLLVWPACAVVLLVNLALFPADVQLTTPGWEPGDSDEDRELEEVFETLRRLDVVVGPELDQQPLPIIDSGNDHMPGPLPLSTPKDPPISLEGIGIAIAVSAAVAYNLYTALEPFF